MKTSLYHRLRSIGAIGLFSLLLLSLLPSCAKDTPDNKYRGENKIQLRLPDGSRSVLIAATSTSPIKVTVRLTSRRTDAVTLQLNLTGEAASSLTPLLEDAYDPRRSARGRGRHHAFG